MSSVGSRALLAVVMALVLGVTVLAQAPRPPLAPKDIDKDEGSKVILTWDTYRKLTEHERLDGEPKLTLPWKDVEDLLGVKVENVEGANLTLDWKQFRALLKWSLEKKPIKPPAPLPPAEFVVASSEYSGVLKPEGATFDLTMVVDILKEDGWKRIPLLPTTVALDSAKLPENCYLNIQGNRYEMLTSGKGRMTIQLKFAASVVEQAGTYQVRFDTVPSGTSVLKLSVPDQKAAVKVAAAQAVLPMQAKPSETAVAAFLPSAAPVQISWERALEKVEAAPAQIYAETRTLVAVGEGILTCRERVELSILHSGIRSVTLSVPAQVSVLDVTGQALQDWRVDKDKLEIRFAHDVTGAQPLSITYEAPAAKDSPKTEAPILRVPGAVREKGYVGVVALANVEITAADHPGATAIDARELPAEILQMTTQPVLLAFRYVGKDFSMPLSVQKHEDVKVLVTIVDTGHMTIMQTIDGRRITKAIYNVRNNRNQFLRMKLPKGAEVWYATVAGKSIRPALDEEERVLIPLVRSGSASVELSSFPVELVYVEKQDKVAEKGQMRIDLPTISEPVTQLMAQLYVPSEGEYRKSFFVREPSFAGPLRLVKQFSMLQSVPAAAPKVDAAAQAQQLQEEFTKRAEVEAKAAGVTPIRVQLPIRGKVYNFEKILVLDEPLWITFDYSGWKND